MKHGPLEKRKKGNVFGASDFSDPDAFNMLIGIHFQPLMDIDGALSALRQLNKKLKCENP